MDPIWEVSYVRKMKPIALAKLRPKSVAVEKMWRLKNVAVKNKRRLKNVVKNVVDRNSRMNVPAKLRPKNVAVEMIKLVKKPHLPQS